MNNQVLQHIDLVMQQFLSAQELITKLGVEKTIEKLENEKKLFQSVGFEAVSMMVAEGILQQASLNWLVWDNLFSTYKNQYASQFLTGLGWALAKNQVSYSDKLNSFSPFEQVRVLDGYGYFYGLFRSRTSVRTAIVPELILEKELPYFDIGLGRSLWYLSKGNIEQLNKFLAEFSKKRHASLILGIGLASTFVGGLTKEDFSILHAWSADYQSVFENGVLLANRSCFESKSVSAEMENHIKQLFQLTSKEAYQKIQEKIVNEKAFINEFITLAEIS